MHPKIQAHVESVGPKNGQRRITLSVNGITFGVFDGYKQSNHGHMQVATPEWLEGLDVSAVLLVTMSIDVAKSVNQSEPIEPSKSSPTNWKDHTFHGTVESLHERTSLLLKDVRLFDGIENDGEGIGIDTSPYHKMKSAVLRNKFGSIILDLSDVDVEISPGDEIKISGSRIDLLGYRGSI